jgi:hypothetical protein
LHILIASERDETSVPASERDDLNGAGHGALDPRIRYTSLS